MYVVYESLNFGPKGSLLRRRYFLVCDELAKFQVVVYGGNCPEEHYLSMPKPAGFTKVTNKSLNEEALGATPMEAICRRYGPHKMGVHLSGTKDHPPPDASEFVTLAHMRNAKVHLYHVARFAPGLHTLFQILPIAHYDLHTVNCTL